MSVNNPSNIQSRKAILGGMQEISSSMTRIAAERELIKEIVNRVSEENEIDKKLFRRMAKTFHKDSYSAETTQDEEFSHVYELVTNTTSAPQQEDDHDEDN